MYPPVTISCLNDGMPSEHPQVDESDRLITELRLAILPPPRERAMIRRDAGATLRDIARPLEVSPYTVLRWERGEIEPKRSNAIRYGALLERLREVGR